MSETASTLTLVEFLRARLDEDEAAAEAAGGGEWAAGCRCDGECRDYPDCTRVEGEDITIYPEGGHNAEQAQHIARHDPARVLREVEAKRRIIDALAEDAGAASGAVTQHEFGGELGRWMRATAILRLLALPYADHDDFRDEWRP